MRNISENSPFMPLVSYQGEGHEGHLLALGLVKGQGVSRARDLGLGKLCVNPEIRNIQNPGNIKIRIYSHSPSQACEGMFAKLNLQD